MLERGKPLPNFIFGYTYMYATVSTSSSLSSLYLRDAGLRPDTDILDGDGSPWS